MYKHKIKLNLQFLYELGMYGIEYENFSKTVNDLSVNPPAIYVSYSRHGESTGTVIASGTNQSGEFNLIKTSDTFKYRLYQDVSLGYVDWNDSIFSPGIYNVSTPKNARTFSQEIMAVLAKHTTDVVHLVVDVLSRDKEFVTYQLLGLVNAINAGIFPLHLQQIDLFTKGEIDRNWTRSAITELIDQFDFIEDSGTYPECYNLLFNNRFPTKIFLCHSSQDKAAVEEFANKLLQKKSNVWFDKWDIKYGESIVQKINEGLSTMTHLVIFLSNTSINSPWVKDELSSGIMRKLNDSSVKIIPIKLDEVEVPTIINHLKYASCNNDSDNRFDEVIMDILA